MRLSDSYSRESDDLPVMSPPPPPPPPSYAPACSRLSTRAQSGAAQSEFFKAQASNKGSASRRALFHDPC